MAYFFFLRYSSFIGIYLPGIGLTNHHRVVCHPNLDIMEMKLQTYFPITENKIFAQNSR